MHEEPSLGLRQAGQQLEAEVVGHQPILAGERLDARRTWRSGLQRQRGQVQASRPAFGSFS